MGLLDHKVAIITGAARGMGAEHARRFVAEGASVVLIDVLEDQGKMLADELGEAATFVTHDVADEHGWIDVVALAERTYGHLDILVNNAGIVRQALITETDLALYEKVIGVNQIGVFLGMKAAFPALERAGGGSIVNVSSINGMRASIGSAAYVSSKFAVRGLTQVGALEGAAKGIRVNSVHPGLIATPMVEEVADDAAMAYMASTIPMARAAKPAEVTGLVLFLASDDASYITGSETVVDGGWLAKSFM